MSVLVEVHSIWRWVVLAVAIVTIVKAWLGWRGQQPFGPIDNQLGMSFTMALDIQVLLGLILYIGERRWLGLAAAGQGDGFFFALIHPVLMLIALGAAHVGRARSRRAPDDAGKHRASAIFYLVSLLIIAAAIPWSRL